MKKWIAMLLVTVLLLNVGCALADVDTEITFQDIPWESSAEDVLHIVYEKGLAETKTKDVYAFDDSGEYLRYDSQKNYVEETWSDLLSQLAAPWYINEEKTIAGYNLYDLRFHFITENDESHLICIDVSLDWKSNEEKAYADLQKKLTTVYGEGFHQEDGNGVLKYSLWKGADNTAVMLSYYHHDRIHLFYGVLDVEERLAQIEVQEEVVDPDDTSGL